MSQQEMSYAQALNEAKQMIVQQQLRIKADAEKLKLQQQTILDQSASISESERRTKELSGEVHRLTEELSSTSAKLNEATTARSHAEAVIDSQGQRITSLQSLSSELERKVGELSEQVSSAASERDALRSRLPTEEDQAALSAMAELLSKRAKRPGCPTMRMADDHSEPGTSQPTEHAQAA